MILPVGADANDECTTDFGLMMRPVVKFLVFVQFALAICRFFLLDIWGGLVLICTGVCGTFIFFDEKGEDNNPPMQLRSLCMWGALCAFQCVIETILATYRVIHFMNGTEPRRRTWDGKEVSTTTLPPGQKPQGGWDNADDFSRASVVVAVTVPVVLLVCAVVAYLVYADHAEERQRYFQENQAWLAPNYNTMNRPPGAAAEPAGAGPVDPNGPQVFGENFQAFQGRSHRMDDTPRDAQRAQ
mmetsp:Transcript_19013/g.42031  ORF Transcript_19013/g.42031 Transcript_19013/m.42031 type:complete len:242 (-) Transcript_19013:237-962(-)